jgi:hypothetical protein
MVTDRDPWSGGPRRGTFATRAEAQDPALVAAAHRDPARQFVTLCPLWFSGRLEVLAGLQADDAAGGLDAAELGANLAAVAADLWALASGYAGAASVDLTDPALPDVAADFLADVLGEQSPRAVGLLPGWYEAVEGAWSKGA